MLKQQGSNPKYHVIIRIMSQIKESEKKIQLWKGLDLR